MDKLIIIGNGFDRAHGLKTSYQDFMTWYLMRIFEYKFTSKRVKTYYEDQLLKVYYNSSFIFGEGENTRRNETYLEWLFESAYNTIDRISPFLNIILQNLLLEWVDIENAYFDFLITIHEDLNAVEQLNADFSAIRDFLIEYLMKETENDIESIDGYLELFKDGLEPSDRVLFLNFNYTDTIRQYMSGIQSSSKIQLKSDSPNTLNTIDVINIHGSLNGSQGEPIFGIGDEHNEKYKEFQNSPNIKEYLAFSKSQWYLRERNYQKLLHFIDKGTPFDIEIYGHSCGLSDRTLFKEITSNPNLHKIKVHYHEGFDNYNDVTLSLLSHFDDNMRFRRIVLPFPDCSPMPQAPVD